MSDLPPLPNQPPAGAPDGQPQGPLIVNLQYVKDLSFEVPGAPEIYTSLREQPRIDVALDVQARALQQGGNVFEVTLQIRCEAKTTENVTAFIVELAYCGIFTVNVQPDVLEPVLLVECPRLLFPFARNILSDVTRDGGFMPVALTPIDFVALWQSRRGQQQAQGGAPEGTMLS
ncbi:protein-export chaperone SecB [Roseomonas xinghualingensis]|uniref:protein-export chaperone SecB n=1 Tax=Roseomonas xinghualingensis TaxID=2986475 RepID=UPI0021F12E77|nr:protein-export chaperone SecB [Roseomonas sp. SXEYE001]MCV4205942.1 protein-export chaperone SecB [Roseomonas sp. SXEYE001]